MPPEDLEIIVLEPEDFVIVDAAPEAIDLVYLGNGDFEAFEQDVIRLTNRERVDRGIHGLKKNENLYRSALAHAVDMSENLFISHTSSDGSKLSNRVDRADYRDWVAIGENLAMGHRTPEEVIEGWMESPGHRKNLLSDKFLEIGVAFVLSDVAAADGSLWQGGYWVQNFGACLSTNHVAAMVGSLLESLHSQIGARERDGQTHLDDIEIVILEEPPPSALRGQEQGNG